MHLDQFRTEVRRRLALPIDHDDHVNSGYFPLIMRAAEERWALKNSSNYTEDEFMPKLVESLAMFGSFCGWASSTGNVDAFGYAYHERYRYCFTPDAFEAEQTMAHISTSNDSIEDMMSNIQHPKDKTRRMVRGILTFCHSVNNNPWWHEQVLRCHFQNSPSIDFNTKAQVGDPSKDQLTRYLYNVLPNEMPLVRLAQPYGHINPIIETTNKHAMTDRDVIKVYDDQTMHAKFRPTRMYHDRFEAGYYGNQTTMPVALFQKSLQRLGYTPKG